MDVRFHIREAKASKPGEGFIPNPKLKLLDQVSQVTRFDITPYALKQLTRKD